MALRDDERVTAAAMAGDPAALPEVVGALASGRLTVERMGARAALVIAHRAASADPPLDLPPPLRALRARSAALWILIERLLETVATALGSAGVAWAPFKGGDLATRIHPDPALRPMSDVDLLVEEGGYRRAREALEASGWESAAPGPRFDRYVEEEGSAWTATHPEFPVPLELHLRLWGFVPDGLGDTLLARAEPDPAFGPTGRRLRWADAFLVSAVHPWLHLPPRKSSGWWEVRELLVQGGAEGVAEIRAVAAESELELPVALSAARVAVLWGTPEATRLADALAPALRRPECALVRWAGRRTPDELSIERLALARLLAGRASRSGLLPVVRRIWAHPGIVERLTPEEWSWPRRRLVHVLQCLRVLPAARADWWRAPTHGRRAGR